ncbi:hypothetical protein PoB_003958100 [Plakobranchus ocellatus]|uniref:Uncharacterized protein n=1 Tax=Plakobranchus ocellatus TaxID=259542 RepID=A0AAV4API0_9GAST|nr:hypothetical protein PoB_003958100 [Plakobranchus ocellatus]
MVIYPGVRKSNLYNPEDDFPLAKVVRTKNGWMSAASFQMWLEEISVPAVKNGGAPKSQSIVATASETTSKSNGPGPSGDRVSSDKMDAIATSQCIEEDLEPTIHDDVPRPEVCFSDPEPSAERTSMEHDIPMPCQGVCCCDSRPSGMTSMKNDIPLVGVRSKTSLPDRDYTLKHERHLHATIIKLNTFKQLSTATHESLAKKSVFSNPGPSSELTSMEHDIPMTYEDASDTSLDHTYNRTKRTATESFQPPQNMALLLDKYTDFIISTGWTMLDLYMIRRRQFTNEPSKQGQDQYRQYLELYNQMVPPIDFDTLPLPQQWQKKKNTKARQQPPKFISGQQCRD